MNPTTDKPSVRELNMASDEELRALEDYAAKLAGIDAERDMLRDCLFRAHSSIEVMSSDLDMRHREQPLLDEIAKLLWGCRGCGGSGLDAPHTDRWCDTCAGTGVTQPPPSSAQSP